MSAIEPRPGDVYLMHSGRHLYVETVSARTVTYRDSEQDRHSPPFAAPRWLFELAIAKRVPRDG